VALLEHGTITHVGTHRDLLERVPAYRDLLAADGFDPVDPADPADPAGPGSPAVEEVRA
jgi:ATP-binding cassette subfamily B protein